MAASPFLSTLPARGATTDLEEDKIIYVFLSTLPARGATLLKAVERVRNSFLSTLPARGATHRAGRPRLRQHYFYPRSPRGERPHRPAAGGSGSSKFLSTLPARGATTSGETISLISYISIHAPREGSDHGYLLILGCIRVFLSTLPARGATQTGQWTLAQAIFLSTLPARGATHRNDNQPDNTVISIHAPREGSDS